MSDIKNKQHYVFQAYLKKWADKNGKICVCNKGQKRCFYSSIEDVLNKRQMYKIQNLNSDEKTFLELVMNTMHMSNADKEEMRKHINTYLLPYTNEKIVELLKTINPISHDHPMASDIMRDFEKLNRIIKEQKINTEEDFYSDYEAQAVEWFDKLVAGDTSFYYVDTENLKTDSGIELIGNDERGEFLSFICIQYFRTSGMRELMLNNINNMIEDVKESEDSKINLGNITPKNILPHIVWILQTKCAAKLSGVKADLQIVRNQTGLPFITSDQPILNMKARVGEKNLDEFVLYYPLSPAVAIIINGGTGTKVLEKKSDVNYFNELVWNRAFDYIVGKKEVLEGMLDMYEG